MHMIIPVDAETVCDKNQHPFVIKTLNKLEIEGNYFNIIKTYLKIPQWISYSVVTNGKLFH